MKGRLRAALADARKRFGEEVRARYAAEREAVRLAQALGLDFGQRYPTAAALRLIRDVLRSEQRPNSIRPGPTSLAEPD